MPRTGRVTIWTSVLTVVLLISTVIFVLSLIYTNPQELGPAGVTFWFINLLLMSVSITTILLFILKMRQSVFREQKLIVLVRSFRTGFLVGFSIVVLLALSSLRSLGLRDIILFVLTVVLIEIYFRTKRADN